MELELSSEEAIVRDLVNPRTTTVLRRAIDARKSGDGLKKERYEARVANLLLRAALGRKAYRSKMGEILRTAANDPQGEILVGRKRESGKALRAISAHLLPIVFRIDPDKYRGLEKHEIDAAHHMLKNGIAHLQVKGMVLSKK